MVRSGGGSGPATMTSHGFESTPIWGRPGAWSVGGRVRWGGVGWGGREQVCDYLHLEALGGSTAGGSASGFFSSTFGVVWFFVFCETPSQGIALWTSTKRSERACDYFLLEALGGLTAGRARLAFFSSTFGVVWFFVLCETQSRGIALWTGTKWSEQACDCLCCGVPVVCDR